MVITEKWLLDCRTDAGGWTNAQFAALGWDKPPQSGWKQQLIGHEIDDETAKAFRDARLIRSKPLGRPVVPAAPPKPSRMSGLAHCHMCHKDTKHDVTVRDGSLWIHCSGCFASRSL